MACCWRPGGLTMTDYGNNQTGPARWIYCVEIDQYGAMTREVWIDHNRRDDRIALGQRCREAFEARRHGRQVEAIIGTYYDKATLQSVKLAPINKGER